MLPFYSLISFDKKLNTPVYLQICNSVISTIKEGFLKKGTKLPGSRSLAATLGVHRKTIVSAYEELQAQGWITINPSSGAFISDALPDVKPKSFKQPATGDATKKETGYFLKVNEFLDNSVYTKTRLLELNDGFPDERLAPMDSLARAIRSVLKGNRGKSPLSYDEIPGNRNLRKELARHLNETRGFNLTLENIFVTRGSVNALYLCCSILLQKGDNVIVGELGYRAVNLIVQNLGANLIKVPVDRDGLCVETLDRICKQKQIRAIYVTPHHHYPTTVTMPPERRIALLQLAEKYKIAILEDDYDYDYHYLHSPFLPLASSDPSRMVIYIGSFSKTFSPAFRVGYIAAPENLIFEISKLRRIVDRQGDSILEQAMAELFKQGEIKAHLRKTQKEYRNRRDLFVKLLKENFAEEIQFETPEGGMAVWTIFNKKIPLSNLSKKAAKNGLYLSDGLHFTINGQSLNAARLGFAGLNSDELEEAVFLLKKSISL